MTAEPPPAGVEGAGPVSVTVTGVPARDAAEPWTLVVGPWAPDTRLRRAIAEVVAERLAAAAACLAVRVHVAIDVGGDPAWATSIQLDVREMAVVPPVDDRPSPTVRSVAAWASGPASPALSPTILATAEAAGIGLPPQSPAHPLATWRIAADAVDRVGSGGWNAEAVGALALEVHPSAVAEPPPGWIRTRSAIQRAGEHISQQADLLAPWAPRARELVEAVGDASYLAAVADAGLDAGLVRDAVTAGEIATIAALVATPTW